MQKHKALNLPDIAKALKAKLDILNETWNYKKKNTNPMKLMIKVIWKENWAFEKQFGTDAQKCIYLSTANTPRDIKFSLFQNLFILKNQGVQ